MYCLLLFPSLFCILLWPGLPWPQIASAHLPSSPASWCSRPVGGTDRRCNRGGKRWGHLFPDPPRYRPVSLVTAHGGRGRRGWASPTSYLSQAPSGQGAVRTSAVAYSRVSHQAQLVPLNLPSTLQILNPPISCCGNGGGGGGLLIHSVML